MKYRVAVEAGWLSTLGSGIVPDVDPLSDRAQEYLQHVAEGFDPEDAEEIKGIEAITNHDVKAVEVWLRQQLGADLPDDFREYTELVHVGCTSEDINNLAYAMMLRDLRNDVLIPTTDEIKLRLTSKALKNADVPMLARTHGQAATPTTLGKEMAVFARRIDGHQHRLASIAILGKFNGASGNYNAMTFAYPEVDWAQVSKDFVSRLGFDFNGTTTQIEPHDWMAAYFNEVGVGNTVLTDVSRDFWTYISQGYFRQPVKEGEVGSSTMPHKVNPIDFENAEGNFGIANALLGNLAARLPISRLQRDLSDSTTQRSIGTAAGHTLVGYKSLSKGLSKVVPDREKIQEDLDREWAVLTEPVQTVMRRYGVTGAYDAIKTASRGRALTQEDYLGLVDSILIPDSEKERLRALTPATYIGRAADIARGDI
jgi:adenylosuccinate lyase